jgi:hypothetical protein
MKIVFFLFSRVQMFLLFSPGESYLIFYADDLVGWWQESRFHSVLKTDISYDIGSSDKLNYFDVLTSILNTKLFFFCYYIKWIFIDTILGRSLRRFFHRLQQVWAYISLWMPCNDAIMLWILTFTFPFS